MSVAQFDLFAEQPAPAMPRPPTIGLTRAAHCREIARIARIGTSPSESLARSYEAEAEALELGHPWPTPNRNQTDTHPAPNPHLIERRNAAHKQLSAARLSGADDTQPLIELAAAQKAIWSAIHPRRATG